jgi:hypothetical protein
MAGMIDDQFRRFVQEEDPQTSLQIWVVYELARATVQLGVTRNLLLRDTRRRLDRADSDLEWSAAAEERMDRLAARLPKDPYTVARALERTKQGASFLLYNYQRLADAIEESGRLNDVQRELLFDLRGVPHALRTGTRDVPAGTDGPGLAALVARETRRLQLKHDTELSNRDRMEQYLEQNCLFKYNDSITRGLKSDESRAERRVHWAIETLKELKGGANPATLIDNETAEPLDPAAKAPTVTRSKPASAASPPPPPTPTPPPPPPSPPPSEADAEPSPSPFRMPPMPADCPEEVKQTLGLIADAYHRDQAPSGAAAPPSDDPSKDPGAPSA